MFNLLANVYIVSVLPLLIYAHLYSRRHSSDLLMCTSNRWLAILLTIESNLTMIEYNKILLMISGNNTTTAPLVWTKQLYRKM